jgi:hypothetical protein
MKEVHSTLSQWNQEAPTVEGCESAAEVSENSFDQLNLAFSDAIGIWSACNRQVVFDAAKSAKLVENVAVKFTASI